MDEVYRGREVQPGAHESALLKRRNTPGGLAVSGKSALRLCDYYENDRSAGQYLGFKQATMQKFRREKNDLLKHVSEIKLVPAGIGRNRHYVVEGTWDLLGGEEKRIRMVARACLEVIHNALGGWLVRRWALPGNGRRPCRS